VTTSVSAVLKRRFRLESDDYLRQRVMILAKGVFRGRDKGFMRMKGIEKRLRTKKEVEATGSASCASKCGGKRNQIVSARGGKVAHLFTPTFTSAFSIFHSRYTPADRKQRKQKGVCRYQCIAHVARYMDTSGSTAANVESVILFPLLIPGTTRL